MKRTTIRKDTKSGGVLELLREIVLTLREIRDSKVEKPKPAYRIRRPDVH